MSVEQATRRSGAGPPSLISVLLSASLDAVVSRGLEHILSGDSGVAIVAAEVADHALADALTFHEPAVAIVDESFLGTALEHIQHSNHRTGFIVLAHRPTPAFGLRLVAAGAGCLPRSASAAQILAAVRATAEGSRLLVGPTGAVESRRSLEAARLTKRELDVLEYLVLGRSHAEIAAALQLGVETVRTHSANIRRKVGVRSKRDLIGMTVPTRLGQ